MTSSVAEIHLLTRDVAAYRTTLDALSVRSSAIEKQYDEITKSVTKVLYKLLALVHDEIQFGNDIVRTCSGWKRESTTQAWIPDTTAKRLRRWHHSFSSNVEQLRAMIEAQVEGVKAVKDLASNLFYGMTAFHIQKVLPMQQAVEKARRNCIAEREALPKKRADLTWSEMKLLGERQLLVQEAQQLCAEITALRRNGDMSDAKALTAAGGGLGLTAMAVGSFIPPLGIAASVLSIIFSGTGARLVNRLE
jgi:hypothetical protein